MGLHLGWIPNEPGLRPRDFDQPAPSESAPDPAMVAALEAAHHALKRIRVVRQVRVDGQVVEEQAAEEYIEVDADPEPVKARLREQLRLRAEAAERVGGGERA